MLFSKVLKFFDLLEDSEDPEKTRDYLDSRQMANSEITKQRATEAANTYSDNSGISDYAKQLAKSLGVKPEDVQNSLNAAEEAKYEAAEDKLETDEQKTAFIIKQKRRLIIFAKAKELLPLAISAVVQPEKPP